MVVGLVIAALLLAMPGLALANADLESKMANPKNWAAQAGDMFNQRYSKLKQINKGNVGKMQVAWTFSTGVLRGHEGSPLVIDGTTGQNAINQVREFSKKVQVTGLVVTKLDGTRATRSAAGKQSFFSASLGDAALKAYNVLFPNRIAIKHAHSQQNPEKDWGRNTLQAVEFAFYVLNEKFGETDAAGRRYQTIKPGNTVVEISCPASGRLWPLGALGA